MTAPCVVPGCTSKSARRIKGACSMHDSRMRARGEYGPAGRERGEWHSLCSVDGCRKKASNRGMCSPHGRRLRLYGSPIGSPPPAAPRPCAFDGCESGHWARGYCRKHYKRWIANGSVQLTSSDERFWRQVIRGGDAECWPWTGAMLKGYGRGRTGRAYFYAHRRSYEMHVGPIPRGSVVRHRCDNPACVNPAHLEAGSQAQNIQDMVNRQRGWWQRPCGEFASREDAIRALRADGLTLDEIAARTGMHRETARRYSKRLEDGVA